MWGWFSSTSGWHLHLFLAKRHLKKLTLAHGLKWIRHLGASHLLPLPNACEWSRLTFSFLFNMNAHQSRNFQRIRCLSAYQRNRYAKISIDRSDVKRWQSFCVEHGIPGWWDPDSHLHSHKKKPRFSAWEDHGKIMGRSWEWGPISQSVPINFMETVSVDLFCTWFTHGEIVWVVPQSLFASFKCALVAWRFRGHHKHIGQYGYDMVH